MEAGGTVYPISARRSPKFRAHSCFAASTIALVVSFFDFLSSSLTAEDYSACSEAATTIALAAIPEKSIAVLPFENLSGEKENAYFADGVQDEILTDLSRVADLKVISRTSVMQYKTARSETCARSRQT